MGEQKNVQSEITDFLILEARLLDDWKLDEWLALYDDKAIYWIPIDEHSDPNISPSIIYEKKKILLLRVEQLMREKRLSQTPRSEIMHQISNITIDEGEHNQAAARYSLLVGETRSGDWRQNGLGNIRFFVGHCYVKLTRFENSWRILSKTIVLLDRKQPILGLSFIL